MSTPYEFNPDRALFGKIIKRWFAAYDLPQVSTEHWAKANGSAGPWASQMSQCQAGKIDPKPAFFVSMGHFNSAIASKQLGPINDRKTLDRLKAAEPLHHDDGTVYAASDFFNLFCGLIKPPTKYFHDAEQEIDDDFLSELSTAIIDGYKNSCRQQMLPSRELWPLLVKKIKERYPNFSEHDERFLQDLVLGIEVLEMDGFAAVLARYGECPALMALAELSNENDSGGKLLQLFGRTQVAS